MTREQVLALATDENPVINNTGNKIEFKDGTCYAIQMPYGTFRKVKCFTL